VQVPQDAHDAAVVRALDANAGLVRSLRRRREGLAAAAAAAVDAASSHPGAALLDRTHFLADSAFKGYIAREAQRVERMASAVAEGDPYAALIRVKDISIRNLGRRAERGLRAIFACCAPPQAPQDAPGRDALFFKVWVAAGGDRETDPQCAPLLSTPPC
jgi:hypothetical protein